MQFKSSALVFAAFGVGPLLLAAGCGDSSGDGAGSLLTPIQPSSYVTIEPATTTTTTTIFFDPDGTISPVEQRYIVVTGDSLSKIAERYDISVDALINYNGWDDGTNHLLLSGDVILIPPNTLIPGTSSAGSGDSGSATPDEPDDGTGCTHTISAGENPTKVAGKYGLTYDQLQAANPFMDFTTTFIVGDVLTIPPEGNC
jgi:LysM repeat protein